MEGEEQKKVAEEMYFSAGGIWSVIMTVVAFVLELEMPLWSELCGLIKFHWKKEKLTKKKKKGVRTAKSFPFFSALHHPLAHRFVHFVHYATLVKLPIGRPRNERAVIRTLRTAASTGRCGTRTDT